MNQKNCFHVRCFLHWKLCPILATPPPPINGSTNVKSKKNNCSCICQQHVSTYYVYKLATDHRTKKDPFHAVEVLFWIVVISRVTVRVMMFNSTFNNIPVISWRSVLVEETGVPKENHRPTASLWQTSYKQVQSYMLKHDVRCSYV